jgi:hypothetical protein
MTFVNNDRPIDGYNFNRDSPGISNIFTFSTAGVGTVTIPMLVGEYLTPLPLMKTKWKMLFIGSFQKFILDLAVFFKQQLYKTDFLSRRGAHWLKFFLFSKIILVPRGRARNTERLTEAVHLGRIPFIIHDLFPAIPYLNSPFQLNKFDLTAKMNDLSSAKKIVDEFNYDQFLSMRSFGLKYKTSHFSNAGVFDQIQRFMLTGSEDSDLRCQKWESASPVLR